MSTIISKLTISREIGIRFSSSTVMALTLLLIISYVSTGFVIPSSLNTALSRDKLLRSHHRLRPRTQQLRTYMSKNTNDDDDDDEGSNNEHLIHYNDINEDDEKEDDCEDEREPVFCADVRGRPAGVVLEDLNWRIEKLRLEEANKRRFLKSGPRFLPYTECQKWVQAWGNRWTSAEEWYVHIRRFKVFSTR